MRRLERQAAADGLLSDHLRIHKAAREIRTTRGLILAGCAVVVVVAALVTLSHAPVWAWVAAAALPVLARAGRPAGKPIVTAATLPATVQAPDQDVITRALGSLGIAGIDQWLRDGRPLVSPRRSVRMAPEAGRNRAVTRMPVASSRAPPGWAATATRARRRFLPSLSDSAAADVTGPAASRESHTGNVTIVPSRSGSYGGIACRTTKSAVVKAVISGRRMRGCAVS
jgi:hypothetical protein